jgi:hypothetical protein
MIQSLSESQKAQFPDFIKKWKEIGLCTKPANRAEAERGVKLAYEIAVLKEPKIVWCGSPLSQGLTRAVVFGLKKYSAAGKSVRASVRDSVGASVWASVWDSVGASVWDSVWDSVGASVRDSVGIRYMVSTTLDGFHFTIISRRPVNLEQRHRN